MQLLEKINPIISRISNQYFYGSEVGVYIIELQNQIILFDLPTYSQELKSLLQVYKKPINAILSHGSCGISDGSKWQKGLGIKVYLHEADKHSNWLRMKPDILYTDIPYFDKSIEIIHTPGHSKGSICLLEKTSNTLFVGDTVGGKKDEIRDFTIEDHNDDIGQRIESCRKLLEYDFESILPFHYEMILKGGKEAIKEFLDMSSY